MLTMNRKAAQPEIVDTTTERHGNDFVTIKTVKSGDTFNFAVECRLGSFIKAPERHGFFIQGGSLPGRRRFP